MTERSFPAFGVSLDNHLFEGTIHGDDKKSINTWMFEIDMDVHPYLLNKERTFLKLKDVLVNLGQWEDSEGV